MTAAAKSAKSARASARAATVRRAREIVATVSAALRELEAAGDGIESAETRALTALVRRVHAVTTTAKASSPAAARRLALMQALEHASHLPEPADLQALRATATHDRVAAQLLTSYPRWREVRAIGNFAAQHPEHAQLLAPASLTATLNAWALGRGQWAHLRRLLIEGAQEAAPPTPTALKAQWEAARRLNAPRRHAPRRAPAA